MPRRTLGAFNEERRYRPLQGNTECPWPSNSGIRERPMGRCGLVHPFKAVRTAISGGRAMKAILGIGIFTLAIWLVVCLLAGQAEAQYPYYSGYYGMANPYWSADLYQGSLPWGTSGNVYYYVYSPGGQFAGTSAYNHQSRAWNFYNGQGYLRGYSDQNPYWSW